MAGVRLPIRTHPLHAFVTNDYAQGFGTILASHRARLLRLADRARPDAHRRRVRLASRRTRASRRSRPCALLATRSPGCCRSCATCGSCGRGPGSATSRPTTRRSWARPASTASWSRPAGDVGLQGDPGRRREDGRADRHGPAARADRAVRARPLPARPRPGRPGLGGDALMLWLDCPRCGRRPLDEFTFGGERRPTPGLDHRPGRARLRRGLDLRQPRRRRRPSAGSTRLGCRRWLTVRRDTSIDVVRRGR